MKKLSELIEMSVFSIEDGVAVNRIARLAVNPSTRKVEFVAFSGSPWYEPPFVMPWSGVKAVGPDMITVKSNKDIKQPEAGGSKPALARSVDLIGLGVVDASGRFLGRVEDFAVDEADGSLVKLMLAGGAALDMAAVVTVSSAAVVTEGAPEQAAPKEEDFLLGKVVAADIADEHGDVVVHAGAVVTKKEIEAAKAAGVLYELLTGAK